MKPGIALALAMAALPASAQAADACLAPADFSALTAYGMPSAITGTADRCAATLPAGAFLRAGGGKALADRYAAARPAQWPAAKAALGKLLTITAPPEMQGLLTAMPDPQQQQLVDTFVAGMVAEKLPASRCAVVDRLLSLLAPLPPESTAEAIGLAIGLGARSGVTRLGKIVICTP